MKQAIVCAQWGAPLFDFPATVILYQNGIDSFSVRYGKQIKHKLNYIRAASEFGECVMHAAACNSNLDNRTREEARDDMAIQANSVRS